MADAGIEVVGAGACMTRPIPVGEVRPLGDRALLIGVADAAAGRALVGSLERRAGRRRRRGGVRPGHRLRARDVTPTRTLAPAAWTRCAACVDAAPASSPVGDAAGGGRARHHPVPLRRARPRRGGRAGRAARATRWSALLTAAPLTVAVVGFSPGFAYLDGLPARLARRCRGATGRVPPCRPARWPWPTGTPPSTRRPRRAAGSWWGGPAFPLFSLERAALRRAGAGGPRAASPWRAPASRSSRAARSPPAWAPPTRAPSGVRGRWRRGCAPSSRTAAAAASPPSGVPAAGPADPVSFALANRPGRQRAGCGGARDHGRRDAAALPRAVSRRGGRRGARGARRRHRRVAGGPAAAARGRARCSRSAALHAGLPHLRGGGGRVPRAGAASGASASDELSGLGAGAARVRGDPVRRSVGAAAR